MNKNCGFTLIEVVTASAVLVCGLVAVASVFSYSVRTNRSNRQMAVATTLLCDKMEEFRSAPFNDAIWTNSSGSENLVVEGDRYIRTWQLGSNTPRMVTVAIYAQRNTLAGRQVQLVRATTLVSPTF